MSLLNLSGTHLQFEWLIEKFKTLNSKLWHQDTLLTPGMPNLIKTSHKTHSHRNEEISHILLKHSDSILINKRNESKLEYLKPQS